MQNYSGSMERVLAANSALGPSKSLKAGNSNSSKKNKHVSGGFQPISNSRAERNQFHHTQANPSKKKITTDPPFF